MADTHSALEQLADISEPAFSLGFQLAPLWWLLLVIILLSLGYIALRYYLRWRYLTAKRQALLLLAQMATPPDAAQLNQLIKRVLRHYQPAHPALTMGIHDWQRWLSMQQTLPLPDLASLLYQPNTADTAAARQAFYLFTRQWLSSYRADAPIQLVTRGENHA